jgi:hypothetical protein
MEPGHEDILSESVIIQRTGGDFSRTRGLSIMMRAASDRREALARLRRENQPVRGR